MEHIRDIQIHFVTDTVKICFLAVKCLLYTQGFHLITQVEGAFTLEFWQTKVDLTKIPIEAIQNLLQSIFVQALFKS